jgi:hypothetical protein
VRAKRAQFLACEQIDDSSSKRIIRADYCQIDTIFLREPDERHQIAHRNRDIFGNFAGPGISRGAKNQIRARRLPQLPCKRVLATAAANDENSHGEPEW